MSLPPLLARPVRTLALTLAFALVPLAPDLSAQTLENVLSFLLTNRSIPTGDFVRDEQAAGATRDAIAALLLTELGTLPSGSSASGFTYRLDPTLGTSIRASESFGPLFTDRALTAGALQCSFGVFFQRYRFETIDGRALRDGTLIATASKLRSDAQPFDVEALTLRLASDSVTLQANAGVTDRLDIGASLPIIQLTMSGQRIDTYRGSSVVQAAASGTSIGPGDAIARLKYNIFRDDASGVALALDARLPTGDVDNLLGSGKASYTPRMVASLERGRAALHGNFGYVFGGRTGEIDFGGGATMVATPRLTLMAEMAGRRLQSVGRLTAITSPNPGLIDVETIRLTTTDQSTLRVMAVGGMKWNVVSGWLVSLNVLHPLTQAGLNAGWTPAMTVERSIGF